MSNNEEKSTLKEYFLPISILVAAVLISGSLIISSSGSDQAASVTDPNGDSPSPQNVAEVTEEDHVRGSIDAPIKIVEYSDLECPYCQQFHGTMKQVVEEYDGQVAWVYRHYPLPTHSNAKPAAEASECVAELAGEEAFWNYTDRIFENQSALESGLIENVAVEVGADREEFQECMESNRHIETVENEQNNGTESGAEGTPYSVIVTENRDNLVIPGAQPFSNLSQALDQIISNL